MSTPFIEASQGIARQKLGQQEMDLRALDSAWYRGKVDQADLDKQQGFSEIAQSIAKYLETQDKPPPAGMAPVSAPPIGPPPMGAAGGMTMAPPPQPMAPGQASQPMVPPQPPQAMQPPQQAAVPPPPAAGGHPAPVQNLQNPSPKGALAVLQDLIKTGQLPGYKPQPGGAIASQASPPGGGAPEGGIGPPPQTPQAMVEALPANKLPPPLELFKLMKKQGGDAGKALDHIERLYLPMYNAQQQDELRHLRVENDAQKAAVAAYRAHIAAFEAQSKDTRRVAGAKQGQEKIDLQRQKQAAGPKGAPGVPQAHEPAPDGSEKKDLDAATWRFIQTGQYPSRKGKFDENDYNRKVNHNATVIADELGMPVQELMAQTAEFKANAQSLAFQTKKLDAIEGTLSSFHNNIDTWDNIAKGLPPTFKGERSEVLAKLKSIDFSQSKTFNDVKLKIQSEFNDPAVAAYLVATEAVAVDWARLMQGPQSIASLTEGSRGTAEKLIAGGLNDDARATVKAALEQDAQGQVKGVKDQRDKIKERMLIKGKGGGSSGEPGKGADTNAKGWKLHTDKNGNKAYVSPDGKQFEEAK